MGQRQDLGGIKRREEAENLLPGCKNKHSEGKEVVKTEKLKMSQQTLLIFCKA